jgi:hypothetical protein
MADRPRHVATGIKRRLIGLVVLGGLGCAAPALAADPPPSTDSQLRALSGSDAPRAADALGLHGLSRPEPDQDPAGRASAVPLVRPNGVDAADLSKALAAGNRTSRQLTTPEEDDAGSIGGSLLAIAGLVLAVVLIARFNSVRRG